MANNFFRFKQFSVNQDKCAMKVGTDGVLLGAWCDVKDKKKILDIGSGTGLISLMIAQRNENASIDALEIDSDASLQSLENFQNSPWSSRLTVIQSDFVKYAIETENRYDLIVSNPPFFENSLKTTCEKRSQARHTDTLPFHDLISHAANLLTDNGIIALIYPCEANERMIALAEENKLSCIRQTIIKGNAEALPKRFLSEFSFTSNSEPGNTGMNMNELIIEQQRQQYTPEYIALTKTFYLKMPD